MAVNTKLAHELKGLELPIGLMQQGTLNKPCVSGHDQQQRKEFILVVFSESGARNDTKTAALHGNFQER